MSATTERIDETVEEPQKGVISRTSDTLAAVWKYRNLIPTALTTSLRYYTIGPPQESWDYQTAMFTSIVRANGGSRGKVDPSKPMDPAKMMQAARKRLEFLELKDPKQGVCWETSLPVKGYDLQGELKDADQREDGSRRVLAEWQLHNDVENSATDRVLLYIHGGGYTILNPRTHRPTTLTMSKLLKSRVLSVDYRLSPETPFPGGLHDVVVAYLHLVHDLGIQPASIIVSGDSAGGGLSLALLLYLRDNNMPLPGGAILISPWCDLTASFRTWDDNAKYDYLSLPPTDSAATPVTAYLGADHPERATHAYITSCLADLSGLPPLLIQCGGAETLRDESTLLAHRAHAAGNQVEHQVFEHGVHVFQALGKTDASIAAFSEMESWHKRLPQAQAGEKTDFSGVDQRLNEEFRARRERAERVAVKKGQSAEKHETERVSHVPNYIFEPVKRAALPMTLRDTAHEEVKRAVKEDQERGSPEGVTTIFVPRRNPETAGLMSKVRGALHL